MTEPADDLNAIANSLESQAAKLREVAEAIEPPAPPVVVTNPRQPTPTGRVITLSPGGDLQSAINSALAGDEILLTPGGTYPGTFFLPNRGDDGYVSIRTADWSNLPPVGKRVSPIPGMPKLISTRGTPVLITSPGTRGWYLGGLEITADQNLSTVQELLRLGDGLAKVMEDIPRDFLLDRLYVHGSPGQPVKRGILANAGGVELWDSYISEVHIKGQETHGFGCWSGPGPFLLDNNYISAAGVNVMFGGADPLIPGLSPTGITVRRCHLHKPEEWRALGYTVKNLFECKHAIDVVLEDSVLDGAWPMAQVGYAVQLTAVSDNGLAPWTTVRDVTLRRNMFRRIAGGINVSSRVRTLGVLPDQPSKNFLFEQNFFEPITATTGARKLWNVGGDVEGIVFRHNTGSAPVAFLVIGVAGDWPDPTMKGLVVEDNLVGRGAYGLFGDLTSEGIPALDRWAPGAVVKGNVIYNNGGGMAKATVYPPNNELLPDASRIVTGEEGLQWLPGSPAGCDPALVLSSTRGAVSGEW